MDDQELRALLAEILRVVQHLAGELDRYRELLPEPGSLRARMLRRKATSALEHWNEGT